MRYIGLGILPLVLTGCVTAYHAGAPKGAVDVIAHRGASGAAPENTLAAFQKAIDMQADWFELDCRLTKDNQVVVIHDSSLDRTTTGEGAVPAMTLAAMRAYDAGSWFDPAFSAERLPTLEETLDLAKGKIGVYDEIKTGDEGALYAKLWALVADHDRMTPALRKEIQALLDASNHPSVVLTRRNIEAIRERKMKHQVVVQSFSGIVCTVMKLEAPEIRTEYLGSYDAEKPERWERFLKLGYLIDVDGFNVHYKSINESRLADFHANKKSVAVWTVDDPKDMQRLAALGVDAIITNHPDRCLATLQAAGKR